jgi:hypothetical protein
VGGEGAKIRGVCAAAAKQTHGKPCSEGETNEPGRRENSANTEISHKQSRQHVEQMTDDDAAVPSRGTPNADGEEAESELSEDWYFLLCTPNNMVVVLASCSNTLYLWPLRPYRVAIRSTTS